MRYETDTFPILNLKELTSNYRLFEITGLSRTDEEYDNNIQHIIRSLSFSLKHPITVIHIDEMPFLVVKEEESVIKKVPAEYAVKKGEYVHFKLKGDPVRLDFEKYTSETKQIIIRFLQFDLQSELNRIASLWQPSAGSPFFSKQYFNEVNEIAIYNGFIPRIMELPEGGFGICVDITKKFLAKKGLPTHLTREEFKKLKLAKCHFVYHYGKDWYEIKPDEFSDLNVSQFKFDRPSDRKIVSLIEDIRAKFKDEMPPEVAGLPDDASALIYRTNNKAERRAAAALCYRVYDSEEIGKLHRESVQDPFYRRRFIRVVRKNYFNNLRFGSVKLQIANEPVRVDAKVLLPPDLEFGNRSILSVRGTPDTIQVGIQNLGRTRKNLLTESGVGVYTNAPFGRQYFIMPETIFNTYGNEQYFLGDLMQTVNKMHASEKGYEPKVITYDDRNKRTTTDIGFEILEKIKLGVDQRFGGYAVVMLPAGIEKDKRAHDELAALVVSECFEYQVLASIMHGDTLKDCFDFSRKDSKYFVKHQMKGRYFGYVFGVAINQVLLNNERWPFILSTPLNADLTIGIDVKRYIAGFTFIDKRSKNILTKFDKSSNKEKLSVSQVVKMLVKFITLQVQHSGTPILKIVVHRDGRLFETEREGIEKALQILIKNGVLDQNASVSIVEIPKGSIVPFRVFDETEQYDVLGTVKDNGKALNPKIGSVVRVNGKEAFLCSTGREFPRRGSSNPLFIKYSQGEMDFNEIIEDIYYLTCLAFTKPDDCSRYPLTIKITDRRINTLGSDYNSEELDILKAANITI